MNNSGVLLKPASLRSYTYEAVCGNAPMDLPEEFELNMDEFCDVKDQKNTLKCVSFAASIIGECEYYRRTGEKREMSTGYFYGNEKARNGYMGEGMVVTTAVPALTDIGFVPASYFDSDVGMPEAHEMLKDRDDLYEVGLNIRPTGYVLIDDADQELRLQRIKEAIYKYRRPVFCTSYEYFGGSHAIVLYGWNKKGYLKFQNSYGKKWMKTGRSIFTVRHANINYLLLFENIGLPFIDVNESDWFYKPLKHCVLGELVSGTTETTFSPNEDLKRCDAACIVSRLLDKADNLINSHIRTRIDKGQDMEIIDFNKHSDITFVDVATDSYYNRAVNNVATLGIINGVGNDCFDPEASITRAEIAAMVVRTYDHMLSTIKASIKSSELNELFGYDCDAIDFKDIAKDSEEWYVSVVDKAVRLGVINGYEDGTFRPDNKVIRAEAVCMFDRLFEKIDDILEFCAETENE